jgi:hypothetical protein
MNRTIMILHVACIHTYACINTHTINLSHDPNMVWRMQEARERMREEMRRNKEEAQRMNQGRTINPFLLPRAPVQQQAGSSMSGEAPSFVSSVVWVEQEPGMVPMPIVCHCTQDVQHSQRRGDGEFLPDIRQHDTEEEQVCMHDDGHVAWTTYSTTKKAQEQPPQTHALRDDNADVAKAVQELSHICGSTLEDLSERLHEKRQRRQGPHLC